MPPAISDDESDDVGVPDEIPAKAAKAVAEPDEEEEEEEEDDEEAEDEYRVEKILSHDFDKGAVIYQIKWLGYENEEDLTWEPIENLDGAKDILKVYHKKIGGVPEPPAKGSSKKGKGKSGKRSASEAFDSSPALTSSKKKTSSGRRSNGVEAAEQTKRELPLGSWDDVVLRVTSIVEEAVPVKGAKAGVVTEKKELIGLLEWKKDGEKKTKHTMKVLRQKVPQRLLDYYEQHL
ncbi:hypothetical protein B0A55_06732 [Friedmanniomyces simplex]|uniref:Chromo domain-containing protein n=1 Tax=Friedmanniomyces simplex TaxID=329884 RepID=A0A4U0X2H0_9PEZI|nr:hypothetical protein B0A55_06732 [Friedmanniomyces simplex]